MWNFMQSTGEFSDLHEICLEQGYAGNGAGLNNPDMQDVAEVGPLPQGLYTIGPAYTHAQLGPFTMNLEPDPTNRMFGRSLFRIHGRRFVGDMGASKGCIVLDHAARVTVSTSPDRLLRVIP